MKRMFAMAAMAAVCLIGATAFGQGTPAAPAASTATECKKSDECSDPTPVCDVAKVCRARTPAEDAAKILKDKQDVEKANVESAETELKNAKSACSTDSTKCGDPIKAATQRLAEARRAAAKLGVGTATATAVAGKCYDTELQTCSVEPIRGTCPGSSQILRCSGTLADKSTGGSGASEARLGRLESTVERHAKRISAVEGTQTALLDEADRTATQAEAAYAAAVSDDVRDERQSDASSGSAGDVDADKLAGCVGAKSRFLKRDRRLKDDAARNAAAQTWCLASLK